MRRIRFAATVLGLALALASCSAAAPESCVAVRRRPSPRRRQPSMAPSIPAPSSAPASSPAPSPAVSLEPGAAKEVARRGPRDASRGNPSLRGRRPFGRSRRQHAGGDRHGPGVVRRSQPVPLRVTGCRRDRAGVRGDLRRRALVHSGSRHALPPGGHVGRPRHQAGHHGARAAHSPVRGLLPGAGGAARRHERRSGRRGDDRRPGSHALRDPGRHRGGAPAHPRVAAAGL